VAEECVGFIPPARKGFITPGTLVLVERSRQAGLNGKNQLSRALKKDTVRALRADKEEQVSGICGRVEHHLWSSDSRPAYTGIRALSSAKSAPRSTTVRAADGEVLAEDARVRARWAEYFEELYQIAPPSAELPVLGAAPLEATPPINCDPPSLAETRAAIKQLKGGRAPGVCGIQAELLKSGGEAALRSLHAVFHSVWNTGVIPADWKRGIVVPLWKGKGDRQDCGNYRGVTLLSVPGKAFARVVLDRIRQQLLQHQRPEQAGFTPKRSTVDRVLALRVITERFREFRHGLLVAYVDLRKAFDSVFRDALWVLLGLRGVPPQMVGLVSALYTGTESAVRCGDTLSDFFPVDSGVRQGCVLAPTLFNVCMDWVLERTVDSSGCGVSFGDVRVSDLDFADDVALFTETADALVGSLGTMSSECEALGLRVSWAKTKIQAFNDALDAAVENLSVDGENVYTTGSFIYLGSEISVTASCEQDVRRRLGRAWGAMNSLDRGIWRCRYLRRSTKLRVFRSLVLPVLLYGCETWTLTGDLRRQLNSFQTRSLRRILGYRWSDFVSNDRVLKEAKLRYPTCIIRERQMRLYGHVARFPGEDPVHRILSARDPRGWVRPVGRPRSSWLSQMNGYLQDLGTGNASAWAMARRRPQEYKRKVDAATRCSGACPHT
jgi:hypothetical protein